MAVGDDATAAGIPLVSSATGKVRDGATEINITRDELARRATRTALRIFVGAEPTTKQTGDLWFEPI